MKMVKSLLLGSAAGLFAVAGAQAADLPVKAKAVEYVKVCTLYGAGFHYVPGTDTCLKFGGFVRSEWLHNAAGSFNPTVNGNSGLYYRSGDTLISRTRAALSTDVRTQTEYGTLRAYLRIGLNYTTNDTPSSAGASVYYDRAFIQFAGFTFGRTTSYFDFWSTSAYSHETAILSGDTSPFGTNLAAYTAQFGNGLSATLSIEDGWFRRGPVVDLVASNTFALAFPTAGIPATSPSDSAGNFVPDIVGNIRVDQAWGSAQIMGALHSVRANYYNVGVGGGTGTVTGTHPSDKWGWAAGGGATLNMPWNPKDTVSFQLTWCEGATRYCVYPGSGLGSSIFALASENLIGLAWANDAYFGAVGTSLELSKTWSLAASFEHYWTPNLRSSIYGHYAKYEANSATLDATICTTAAAGPTGPGCADWSAYQIGSRTIWNPVANLDVGVDVLYTKVNTAFQGAAVTVTPTNSPISTLTAGDTHVWSGVFRVQRNFWP